MTIRTILGAEPAGVITVPSTATVASAADRMLAAHVGTLVVTIGDNIAALLSERDIVSALARHGRRALEMHVREIAQRRIVTTAPGDSLGQAMRLMMRHRVRELLVLDNGRPVGIVSLGELIAHRLEKCGVEASSLPLAS